MSGMRVGVGRMLAMVVALAAALLLLVAGEARATKYAVAQCGWYVGIDAAWADSTGGAKFRPDAFCVPGPPADPFDGSHLKSFTRDGQGTVSGTRFARWRWTAPPGTGITQVRGSWWHTLHDGIEQRLGTDPGDGTFAAFGAAADTDVTPREFAFGFAQPQAAFEDRLLCARGEAKWCSLEPGSWSALRALTITVEDPAAPGAWVTGGEIATGGWHRGVQSLTVSGYDAGSGVRFGETLLDGARVALTEYPCGMASIGGEWRGTRMQPCLPVVSATQTIATTAFSDGPHALVHCTTDFAGNAACAPALPVAIDNNPPAHPRAVVLAGGEGWRRVNRFDLSWTDPDQGVASPIWGAYWRITGPGGYDSGVNFAGGRNVAAIGAQQVPAAGAYTLHLWLRDEAGNTDPASAVELPLRFDDAPPKVSFVADDGAIASGQLLADVADPASGPSAGSLFYRSVDTPRWTELVSKLTPTDAGSARLAAALPELPPGTYVFRADAVDAAGNTATTTLRSDGREMALHKAVPVQLPRAKTRLFARLRGGALGAGGSADAVTVPFAAAALLSGRLTRADGAGIAGRELRVVSRPSRGALSATSTAAVTTGERGDFQLRLAPGTSRRLSVVFPGDVGLEPAARPTLGLRVRSGVSLRAQPRSLQTGEELRLSGRVATRGAPVPRRGKLVAIQYLEAASGRWRPVLVTRSDHDGRFHARYRFRYITAPTRIRLRATALAEERWPYAPGSSRPFTVTVGGPVAAGGDDR